MVDDVVALVKSWNREQREDFILKSWMSHDARWYMNVAQEYGFDAANKLNKLSARALGKAEMRRLMKLLNASRIEGMQQLLKVFNAGMDLLKPPDMDYKTDVGVKTLRISVLECFAHRSITEAGIAQNYVCGIYDRVEGWFEALGLKYTCEPQIIRCLKTLGEECVKTYACEFE